MNQSFFTKVFSALLIVMLALGALPITPVYAADTGLNAPTVCNSGGGQWATTGNALASDNAYTTSNNFNEVLTCTFNLPAIPAGQQIDGIEVEVEGQTTGRDIDVDLSWDAGTTFTTPINLNFGVAPDQTLTAGANNNTWGRTWNRATDFTAANFRVRITSTTGMGTTFSLDRVRVRVTYTPDVTAPSFTSIARQTPATSPTNANTLIFRATFSEGVQNVNAADFAVTGTTATITGVATVNTSTYDITISGGDLAALNGTVGLNLAVGQNIQDLAANPLPNTEPATDQTYVVDNTAPSVVSLAIQNPATSPTNANTLVFRITFNENVTNIDANDFDVAGTTANITAVTTITANTVFDLTLTGGDLAGLNGTVTINLDVTGGGQQNITDTAGNALPNPAPNPTASYVVDNTAPTAATITQATGQTDPTTTLPINFQVTFPQAINVSSFVPADITNGGSAPGTKTVTITEIAPNNGTTFNVAINGLTGSGTVTISIAAGTWQDAAGNNNTAASTNTDNSVQYNANTAPTVQAVITDVNVLEDAANTVFSLYPNFQDAESADNLLTYTVTGNTNPGLFTSVNIVDPTNFTLDYAPDANGVANITIRATDPGGLFVEDIFQVTVNAVNDEPSFTASNPAAVNEDAGAQTVIAWASFNPGNASEAGQTATYSVSNLGASCATLLSAGPAVNAAGDLTYTPATNQNGTCTFDVSVQDNGGIANGGDDTSSTQSFTITVNVINDAPSVTVAPDQFRTDATTVIPQGGSTNETSVVFKATATDAESDQYTLEVEVVDNVAAFTNTATCTSPLTNSGTEASTGSCGPFVSGSYKWQYRFVDSNLFASAWTAFAGSDPDFIIDNGSPTVTNVTSSTANGTYFPGNTISIQVTFNEIVNVTGTPQLLLELGAVDGLANYVSGSGTDTLTFTYTVQPGDNTPDLDYVANTSLTLNGGSIQDAALNNASLTLPNPGAAGSLGANKDIVIDALILTVVNNGVGSVPDTGDGSLSENEQVANTLNINQLVVTFNKDVNDVFASTTDPDEVDNPANYILVRSATGVFNTLSCAGGVVAPDIINPVTSVTYSNGGGSGPFVATVTLSAPLTTDGYYRLFVCGTTSIVQANNTALALAGNGIANGTDFVRNFQLVTPAAGGGGGGGGAANDTKLAVAALPATGFAPGRITKLPVQPDELAYSDLGEMWIEIPSLGIKTSIVGVPQTAEGEWDVTWLANNVGWLNGTAFPTWEGNSVVTAHVTNADGVDGPFANLKKLKYGDQIIIHLYGQKYIFEVRNSRLSRPFTTSFAFENLEDASYLTLITCQTYLPKSDTYMHRRVVRAVLISVENE